VVSCESRPCPVPVPAVMVASPAVLAANVACNGELLGYPPVVATVTQLHAVSDLRYHHIPARAVGPEDERRASEAAEYRQLHGWAGRRYSFVRSLATAGVPGAV